MESASVIPQGFGIVSWPVRMLEDFQIRIADWRASKHYPDDPPPKLTQAIGEKLDPWYDSLERIKTAYRIIGYDYLRTQPKVSGWESASTMRNALEDKQFDEGEDVIKLNDTEANILQRICKTPKFKLDANELKTIQPAIPFDPQKRVYRISEALSPMPQKV